MCFSAQWFEFGENKNETDFTRAYHHKFPKRKDFTSTKFCK